MPVSFTCFHALGQLVAHPPSRIVSHLKDQLIRPPRFIRFPHTLAVCEVTQTLPLGDVDSGFTLTEDETRRHFSKLCDLERNIDAIEILCYSSVAMSECSVQLQLVIRRQ